jgi:hypothetical protein
MKNLKVIVLMFVVVIISGCFGGNRFAKLETEFSELGSAYFKQYMDGKLSFKAPVVKHKITLEHIAARGTDIKNFTDKNCDLQSYVNVIVEYDEEGVQKDDFTVENFLTCGDYKTVKE